MFLISTSDLLESILQVLQPTTVKRCGQTLRTDVAGEEGCSPPSATADSSTGRPRGGSHGTFVCPVRPQGELHEGAMIQAERLSLVLSIK